MAKYKVRIISAKQKFDVTIACPDNQFILEAAEDNNLELPYSCRAGSCSTCVAKLVKGTVDQSDQIFLDDDQIGEGFILTCVSYPTSDVTIQTHEEESLF